MESHILSPEDALRYINGGHGKATIVGKNKRYTYKFSSNKKTKNIFVSLLIGEDNYVYLGYINGSPYLNAGQNGNPNHPAFKAISWYINKATTNPEIADKAEFWHSGICCRCGRELTDPESIARGIGPICLTK